MPGSLMIGPLTEQAVQRFPELLEQNDLWITREDAPVSITMAIHDVWIVNAEGPDVLGYLQGPDGCEAPSHDIERFARAVLPEGGSLKIRGMHRVEDDHFVVCTMALSKRDGRVFSEREHVTNKIGEGTRVLIQERDEACLMTV